MIKNLKDLLMEITNKLPMEERIANKFGLLACGFDLNIDLSRDGVINELIAGLEINEGLVKDNPMFNQYRATGMFSEEEIQYLIEKTEKDGNKRMEIASLIKEALYKYKGEHLKIVKNKEK